MVCPDGDFKDSQRMNSRLISILTATILAPAAAGLAQRTHDITIEDYFTQSSVFSIALSPDGSTAAWVEGRWHAEDEGRFSELWVVDVETKNRKRLTFERSRVSSPQWSPDGATIYFAGSFKSEGEKAPPRDGKSQVWRIGADGSGLTPVTHVEDGIAGFQLAGDGSAIFYNKHKEHTIDEWAELRKEFKTLEFGHGVHKISELWKLDLTSWREEKLVDAERYIRYFAVSPDNARIAMITDPDELLITHEGQSKVEILHVSSGEIESLPDELWRDDAPSPYGWLGDPCWSSDSRYLGFSIGFDGFPTWIYAAQWDDEGRPAIEKLKRPEGVEVNGGLAWIPGTHQLAFHGEIRAREHAYSVSLNGESKALTEGDLAVGGFDFSDDQQLLTLQSGLDYSDDLFFEAERLTNLNPQIDTWKLPKTSLVQWQGANGDEVEGILELPPGYEEGQQLPLIVAIHGGPKGMSKLPMQFWIYGRAAFAAKGYAVLMPNYRGSTGYGDKFMVELIGHENEIEVEDILKGVDHVIEIGIADPKKLGVMGWSNGGYLTNCLVATNRFQAASSGAGVFDMGIQFGEEDTPGHVINYVEGLPWEKPEEYRKASPMYALKPGITTATLIHVGEKDQRVPATHSRALHRALHHYIKAPCELLIYPGEPHGLGKRKHRLAKMKWDHAWFDRYLKGEDE
ncbi:MAG: dipeptidyl aminopeptidase/acylaminoacyl peptidase [Verrucomicrobiales bacterium]